MSAREPAGTPAEAPEPGHLCDRLLDYPTHNAYSATGGARGAKCSRPAKAKDAQGVWACGVHLGADKRGQQARKRAATRSRHRSRPVSTPEVAEQATPSSRPTSGTQTRRDKPTPTLRVIEEGYMGIHVIGTEDIEEVKAALPTNVTGYRTAKSGQWIRRTNGLRRFSGQPAPKYAKPGVQFGNVTRAEES